MKLIFDFATNCPRRIVRDELSATNCPATNCPRRIGRDELSCDELSGNQEYSAVAVSGGRLEHDKGKEKTELRKK